MFVSWFLVICYWIVFTTTQESSSLPPAPNTLPPQLFSIAESLYRISTARLTIDKSTRHLVEQYFELDLDGPPQRSLVLKVKSALSSLLHEESKWKRSERWMVEPLSSTIQGVKVSRLVQQLVDSLKPWPGHFVDQFTLEAIQQFDKTIEPVKHTIDYLDCDEWKGRFVSAVQDFYPTMENYMNNTKKQWHSDGIPNLSEQEPVTKALDNVIVCLAECRDRENRAKPYLWTVVGFVIFLALLVAPACVLISICCGPLDDDDDAPLVPRRRPRRVVVANDEDDDDDDDDDDDRIDILEEELAQRNQENLLKQANREIMLQKIALQRDAAELAPNTGHILSEMREDY